MLTINRFSYVRLAIFALLLSGVLGWSAEAENVAQTGNNDPWKVVHVSGAAEYNQSGSGWRSSDCTSSRTARFRITMLTRWWWRTSRTFAKR